MTVRRDILPERLNAAPAIFKGCSSGELGVIVALAMVIWLPVSLALAATLGVVTMGFGIAGIGVVGTVIAVAAGFQRLKRNRPDGYYQQWVVLWLDAKGFRRSRLTQRSGIWDLGRSLDATLPARDR